MRTAIKIAAFLAVVGVIAVVAVTGGVLANGVGTAGNMQGMMGNHGNTEMMNGQNYGHINGPNMSGNGQSYWQGHQGCNNAMYGNGVVPVSTGSGLSNNQNDITGYSYQNSSVVYGMQTHCWGCC